MDLLFGKKQTPQKLLKQNQRALSQAIRGLDRERQRLEQQQQRIIADIKKAAKQGQMDVVRIMAKDLVRTRNHIKKLYLLRAKVEGVSLQIVTLTANNSMTRAMRDVTKAMASMNRQLNLTQVNNIMVEFERQSEVMDTKEDMMNDAMDDAMGDEDDEEESDAIVSQVLDELGLSVSDQLLDLPATGGSPSEARERKTAESQDALADADVDLERRLKNLRGDCIRRD